MKYILYTFSLFFCFSCGLKITTEVEENLLIGSWELEEIKCYKGIVSNSYVERYEMDSVSDLEVTLKIEGQDVQYTVTSDTCTTSATALYSTKFDGTKSGKVDFVKVISGSTCNYTMAFTGSLGNGTDGTIRFAMLSNYSEDLDWEISEDRQTLTLDFFTDFKGSDSTSFCSEVCYCTGVYGKI